MAAISSELNAHLRKEQAWADVAGGLGKVLFGYLALVIGWLTAGAFFYAAFAPLLNHKPMKITHLWYFYIGIATLNISGLLSWGLILAGQWRCLMSSAERRGARWIMFFCMTCVVMGPVLHFLAWTGGLSTPVKWGGGPQAFHEMKIKFTLLGIYLMSASLVTSGLYKLSFWYYLQTVAGCMEAPKASAFVRLFLVLTAAMAGFTGWWFFGNLHANLSNDLVKWVVLGWVALSFYWVAMIVVVKVAIEQTMAVVFNPMQASAKPQYQLAGS